MKKLLIISVIVAVCIGLGFWPKKAVTQPVPTNLWLFTQLFDTPSSLSSQGGKMVSVNSAGTALEFNAGTTSITTLGTITTGTWQATDIDVPYGGTGVSTLTDGGVLLGSGASAITAMGVLANGSIIVGDGATDPVALAAFTNSTGDLIHEAGGLEADVSGYTDGIYGQAGGVTLNINTIAEIETAIGGTNIIIDTEINTSAKLRAIVGDETGTGLLVFSATPTFNSATFTGAVDMTTASSIILADGAVMATSGAPTADAQIANKKYVDDNIGAFVSTNVDDTTWSDGGNAFNTWTFDVSGQDHTMIAGSGTMGFNFNVTATGTIEGGTITESGNAVPNATDHLGFFGGTTSAQLAGELSDETGTGLAVFNGAPSFNTSLDITLDNSDIAPLSPFYDFKRARDGTPTSNVSSGDYLGQIRWFGSHTGSYHKSINIRGIVDNTPGNGDMPGRLEFLTSPDASSTPILRLTIDSTGLITGSSTLNVSALQENGIEVPNATDHLGFFGGTTSAQLLAEMTDETGTGLLVFGTQPTIATPTLNSATMTGLINIDGEVNITDLTAVGNVDLGGATSLEIPNGTDPDITTIGQISHDTDDEALRGFGFGTQFLYAQATKTIQFTIMQPDDLDEKDDIPVWSNSSGFVFHITEISGWADADNADFTLVTASPTNFDAETTIEAITLTTNGTGVYYDTILAANIDMRLVYAGDMIIFDPSVDDLKWVKVTIKGFFDADVN